MNRISVFLYIVSVVAWWAGFNYAAARASTARRRKLLSTAAALALTWPFAFIALAAALATKAAANIMIAIGDHINNTWDAAVGDEGDTTIITKLTPMGTAMLARRDNTEHRDDTENGNRENSDTNTVASEEARPALAGDTPLMPPPPPPAADEADGDTIGQADTGDDAETETINNAANKGSDVDETVTTQKVTLSDLI